MTDQQINAAIAEACGITQPDQYGTLYRTENGWEYNCPDYCNDLNAMHEAEKVLDGVHSWNGEEHHWNAEEAYMGHLNDIIIRDSGQKNSDDWQFLHATARQRAEAFLRTLGKWKGATDKQSLSVQKTAFPPETEITVNGKTFLLKDIEKEMA